MIKLDGPLHKIWSFQVLWGLALLTLTTGSALGVVFLKHETRKLHAELQGLYTKRDQLHASWSQLVLERGTWASDLRVERIARKELGMIRPKKITMISP